LKNQDEIDEYLKDSSFMNDIKKWNILII
jgi:hypothetical protein